MHLGAVDVEDATRAALPEQHQGNVAARSDREAHREHGIGRGVGAAARDDLLPEDGAAGAELRDEDRARGAGLHRAAAEIEGAVERARDDDAAPARGGEPDALVAWAAVGASPGRVARRGDRAAAGAPAAAALVGDARRAAEAHREREQAERRKRANIEGGHVVEIVVVVRGSGL